MRARALTGASPFGLQSTPDVRPLAIIRQNVWLDWIEAEQRAANPGLALPSDKRLAVSFAVAARLLPGWRPGTVAARRERSARPVTRAFVGVEVRGFEPLASSVRERTRVLERPAMLGEKGYRAGTLSDRRCPVLSVVVGWDVAPMWPQEARPGAGGG
jgi:hypothetical protein